MRKAERLHKLEAKNPNKIKKPKTLQNKTTACETYFSDESLPDGFILKAGVCEIVVIIIRWRPINMVTRASCWAWRTAVIQKHVVVFFLKKSKC